MRKTVLAALVGAAVMMPAAAFAAVPMAADGGQRSHGDWHGGDRGGDRGHDNSGDRGSNNGHNGGWQQPQAQPQQQARPQYQPQARPQIQPQARPQFDRRQGGNWNRGSAVQPAQTVQRDGRGDRNGGRPDWNRDGHQAPQQWNGGQRNDGRWNGGGNRADPQANRGGRDGNWNRGGHDNRDGNWNRGGHDNRGGNWNRGWRNDNRYDWNRYRYSNRNAFHLPRYYAPYGWSYGYRQFSVGAILSDMLFAENYWIDDPFYYHLPPAYGPYRWVRYYDDALLVDVYNGQVVDVVHDIFW